MTQEQVDLESVLQPLGEVEVKAKAAFEKFNAVLKTLPEGAISTKVADGIFKRINRVSETNKSAIQFLNKKNQTLTKRIASAATKEQRKAEKKEKAEARLKKAQEKVEAIKKMAGKDK